MVEVYLHYYLRYNYMFRLSKNSHLQVAHESLGNSYTRSFLYIRYFLYSCFLRIHVQPEDG